MIRPYAALLFAVLSCACSSGTVAFDERSIEGPTRIAIALESSSGDGYRLEDAVYELTGPGGTMRWAPGDGGAEPFGMLEAGAYELYLAPGWRLLRHDSDGDVVVDAVLVSDNPARIVVSAGELTTVQLEFALAGMSPDAGVPHRDAGTTAGPTFPARFADFDGDGHGDPDAPLASGEATGVDDGTDCDDADPSVFPGQLEGFTSATAAGSFDYDCDGAATPVDATPLFSCGLLGIGCQSGFRDAVPACGETGTWADCSLFFLCVDREVTVACR